MAIVVKVLSYTSLPCTSYINRRVGPRPQACCTFSVNGILLRSMHRALTLLHTVPLHKLPTLLIFTTPLVFSVLFTCSTLLTFSQAGCSSYTTFICDSKRKSSVNRQNHWRVTDSGRHGWWAALLMRLSADHVLEKEFFFSQAVQYSSTLFLHMLRYLRMSNTLEYLWESVTLCAQID